MHEWKKPRSIALGALLAALAVGIQAAPLYLPLIGISLSSLSTLPVAMAGYLNIVTGVLVLVVSGVVISLWSVAQALVFFCGSGLLGLCLGALIKKRIPFFIVILTGAVFFTMGLFIVGKLLGIPILPWLAGTKRLLLLPLLFFFSLVYSAIWVPVINALMIRLKHYVDFDLSDS